MSGDNEMEDKVDKKIQIIKDIISFLTGLEEKISLKYLPIIPYLMINIFNK